MQRAETTARCLDDETLAAFVDGALPAGERSRVEAHLAGCRQCVALLAESVKTLRALDEADAPVSRRPALRWAAAGVGLAAAASVALALWWPRPDLDASTRSALADLVAAVGTDRPFEPRLTGGFAFGPPRSATRGSDEAGAASRPDVRIAAARLEKLAAARPTADTVAAHGIAALVVGDLDSGLRALEQAVALQPADARAWSNLAAAWLLEAERADDAGGRHGSLARALDASTRAVGLSPTLVEALYNKALAAEATLPPQTARAAWEACLQAERDPEWRREIMRRLAGLGQTSLSTPGDRPLRPDAGDGDVLVAEPRWRRQLVGSLELTTGRLQSQMPSAAVGRQALWTFKKSNAGAAKFKQAMTDSATYILNCADVVSMKFRNRADGVEELLNLQPASGEDSVRLTIYVAPPVNDEPAEGTPLEDFAAFAPLFKSGEFLLPHRTKPDPKPNRPSHQAEETADQPVMGVKRLPGKYCTGLRIRI